MNAPIICFDLDGTLLNHEERIHPNDVEILNSPPDDVILMPCTGRGFNSVRRLFKEHQIHLDRPLPFPTVTQNGTATYLPHEKLLKYRHFPEEVRRKILEVCDQYTDATFMLSAEKITFAMRPDAGGAYWLSRFREQWEPYTESSRNSNIGKITCISDDPKVFDELTIELKNLPVELFRSLSVIFDISPQGISKKSGVDALRKAMNFNGNTIIAAGDGENDLELMIAADYSYSPITSIEHVKNSANEIIDVSKNGLLTAMIDKAKEI